MIRDPSPPPPPPPLRDTMEGPQDPCARRGPDVDAREALRSPKPIRVLCAGDRLGVAAARRGRRRHDRNGANSRGRIRTAW